jgi:hypothetical protein
MLYNIEKKEIKTDEMCIKCQYYDSKLLKCNGLNKCCFEYDETTKTIIDGITKLPLNIKEN